MKPDGEQIHIPRKAVPVIVEALDKNRLVLVHGEPGSGKSEVMVQLYQTLRPEPRGNGNVLLFRIDRLNSIGFDDVDTAFVGRGQSLTDVLEASRTGNRSVLMLDALDAPRDMQRRETILSLVEWVLHSTEWQVVLSVRTFEKQHSERLRQLQKKIDRDASLPSCTECQILPFDDREFGMVQNPEKLD